MWHWDHRRRRDDSGQGRRPPVKTPVSSMLLVLVASFIGSFGAVLLKMGSAHLKDGFRNIFNLKLAAGGGLYLLSTCFFVVALKHGELTVLYPMVSLGYVWTL